MPDEIDEPVSVVDHDPRWSDWYATDAEELSRALGSRLRDVQHVGSTAVPGIAAKPIIDILVAPVDWPLAATDRRMLEHGARARSARHEPCGQVDEDFPLLRPFTFVRRPTVQDGGDYILLLKYAD